jgi:hypothetical protein
MNPGLPYTFIPRWVWIVVAVLLALTFAYCAGKRTGQTDQKLVQNQAQIDTNTTKTKVDSAKADTARRLSTILDTSRTTVRNRIRVVHDTIYAPTDTTDEAIYSPAIAHLIAKDDSLISAQKHALALQDTLIGSLRQGITLRDTRIKLLESRGTSRISHGVQVGVGYCQSSTRQVCGYVGYGVQVRLP